MTAASYYPKQIRRILVVYFSGTGCTQMVANELGRSLKSTFESVDVFSLSSAPADMDCDHLVICFPVYAFNAPKPVFEWLRTFYFNHPCSCSVISVSGGGNITPNKACRARLIRRVERKGFKVVNEDMLVMPSNCVVSTEASVAAGLIDVLPKKTNQIAERLKYGKRHRMKTGVFSRCVSFLGRAEALGARYFGRHIAVNSRCSSCGECARNCPVANITMKDGQPVFGSDCVMCLSCLYGCPENALAPRALKSFVIATGFDLASIERVRPVEPGQATRDATKGILWLGVRRYLNELHSL